MTEERANEIFRTKYPDGEIVRKYASSAGYKYFVVFKEGGRVYYYDRPSYAQLLCSLGFKVAYEKDVRSATKYLAQMKEELAGGYDNAPYHLFRSEKGRALWEANLRERIADYEDYLHKLNTEYYIEKG